MTAVWTPVRRLLFPRWRYGNRIYLGAEHGGDPFKRNLNQPIILGPSEALLDWEKNRSIVTATEALAYSYATRDFHAGAQAAKFLTKREDELPRALVRIAREVLSGDHDPKKPEAEMGAADLFASSRQTAMVMIAKARDALRRDPRNVWKYLDLARAYIVLGLNDKAMDCIRSATYLEPNHRGVLRVVARFYLHIDEIERAHALVRFHQRTPHDPWLIATEISLSMLLERHPKHFRRGREMISQERLLEEHRTELAAALGTLEWQSGKGKFARQYFRESLLQPTDNVVAQIQSVAQIDNRYRVESQHFSVPGSYEANYFRELKDGRIDSALVHCHYWLLDEAFSARPAMAGSFLSASVKRDYETAEQFARTGLRADPDNSTLRNNLAVALAYKGDIEGAEKEFGKIARPFSGEYTETVYLATRGLLGYRSGNDDKGRADYRSALERANPRERCIMLSHWIGEELNSDREIADELIKQFDSVVKESEDKDPVMNVIAKHVRKDVKRQLKLPFNRKNES